ncbi:MAG: hypothetical protein BMS9Abin17_0864 [Acidimicrobiia bacterium]|nr:MAG: hypothetical protein BMS9Abin17_0864 [Acidimicrobiia bacterium]
MADVIAALQATATDKFYQLRFEGDRGWAWRIAGDPTKANKYQTVFAEHPEFFRIDGQGHGSLVWRRQHQKLFDVDTGAEMSRAAYNHLTRAKATRFPHTS